MENRQSWVNLSYLAAAGAVWFLVHALLQRANGVWELEAKVPNFELVSTGLGILSAIVCFAVLYYNHKANQYMNEVVVELTRVTWPAVEESRKNTIVVIIGVLIAGVVLGTLDWGWTKIVQAIFEKVPKLLDWAL